MLLTLLLTVCFGRPLFALVRYSLESELYSHILFIPFISLYLIWLKRRTLPLASEPSPWLAGFALIAGFAMLAGHWLAARAGWQPKLNDYLVLTTLSFLSLLTGACLLILGKGALRAIAFPALFLILIVPLPGFMQDWLETSLQRGSAEAAYVLFSLSGMPVFRQGTRFQLPGFSLEVAPECSGIHSSLVLFITSLLAGYLFLVSPWRRMILTAAVLPLALLRNGLRILIIGQLCVRVGPEMIHSPIHKHGGPLFFVLSLVPFFLLLLALRRSERSKRRNATPTLNGSANP